MVGALARFNNNFEQLTPSAKQAASDLRLAPPCFNPYAGTLVQLVECVHCAEESLELLNQLLDGGLDICKVMSEVSPHAASGVGAVEAPRGLLLHEYSFDEKGCCLAANQVIPTGQNLGNIEADIFGVVSGLLDQSEDVIRQRVEMLVRSYDPCISCSTHELQVRFIRT
jgi:coenzyme F420-reducing hydrogenase alpha subunit